MFLRRKDKDITDEEFKYILLPHYKKIDKFMEECIVPEATAYYLAMGYYHSSMYENDFDIHINSILAELFNDRIVDRNRLKKLVRQLLYVKYGLRVVQKTH